jgi:hypothetical protein
MVGSSKHVKHAAEIRAKLRGQADALGFAAGKRRYGATELHVTQPDFVEELQALADFGDDVARNFTGATGELHLRTKSNAASTSSAEKASMVGARIPAAGFGEVPVRASRAPSCSRTARASWIQSRSVALRANLSFGRPTPPAFLDGIRICAAFHIRQIKQFAEAATFGTPTLRGVVGEILRVKRCEGFAALRAGAFGGVNGELFAIIQRVKRAVPSLRVVNQLHEFVQTGGRVTPCAPFLGLPSAARTE